MRSFRVGLIPVRLVAPLILAAVAVPIVIDLLKPWSEKLKEGLENLKPKDGDKATEQVSASTAEPEVPKAKVEATKKQAAKRTPRTATTKPVAKLNLRKANARRPRKPKASPESTSAPETNPEA